MPRSDTLIEACIRLRAEWFGLMAVLVWWYPRASRRYSILSATSTYATCSRERG